jgi:dipeptidyl-peptidase-4
MDLGRVGVSGWSFGGYFAAMATIRRPELFRCGVAGAPLADWRNYDTHYTERYMGLPSTNVEGYREASVLTWADRLERPLLLIHGLTDDNVYFFNTFRLAEAFYRAGKPYELVLLPGTHMVYDPDELSSLERRTLTFFDAHLKGPRAPAED